MEIFTLSACETTAAQFFGTLLERKAELLLDVRLKNESQLCGFTKKCDLTYFTPQLAKARYVHDPDFAPTPELLGAYIKYELDWRGYCEGYKKLAAERGLTEEFRQKYGQYGCVCILGSATRKRRSHSEILRELLASR